MPEPVTHETENPKAHTISISTSNPLSCEHSDSPYPNSIQDITASILLHNTIDIGAIRCKLLDKAAMFATGGLNGMWQECQAFDTAHAPGAKLGKLENFLSNESFPPDKQRRIDRAGHILFIEEVFIDSPYRGRGIGLLAVDLLIKNLGLDEGGSVVLLQAAPMSSAGIMIAKEDPCERLARHWRRMGFAEWSDSDDAWLCLDVGDKPGIEAVVSELFDD